MQDNFGLVLWSFMILRIKPDLLLLRYEVQ